MESAPGFSRSARIKPIEGGSEEGDLVLARRTGAQAGGAVGGVLAKLAVERRTAAHAPHVRLQRERQGGLLDHAARLFFPPLFFCFQAGRGS